MDQFKKISAALLAGVGLYGAVGPSYGLGYGRPSSRAVLGERLNVSVPLHVEAGDDVGAECLAADVYFGDDKLPSSDVETALLAGTGRDRIIRVTTRRTVNEPVVTVYLAAGCEGKVTRKFIAFADPPETQLPSSGAVAQEPDRRQPEGLGQVRVGGLEVEAGSAIAQAPSGEAAPASSHKAPRRKAPRTDASVAAVPPEIPAADTVAGGPLRDAPSLSMGGRDARRAQPAQAADRLALDPVATEILLPDLRMSESLQGKVEGDRPSPEVKAHRAAALALWRALNTTADEALRDQERLRDLTERLEALKRESAQAQQKAAQLQARLQAAESSPGSPALVYAFGGVAAALAAALGFVLYKGRRPLGRGPWWDGAKPGAQEPTGVSPLDALTSSVAAAEPGESAASALDRTFASFKPHGAAAEAVPLPAAVTPPPSVPPAPAVTFTIGEAPVAPPTAPLGASAPAEPPVLRPARVESPREVSVEELIDLEQQAEFFIVLGQDDAAIDLLESHVHSTTGASPLPFLKLLEIYQRLGQRQDYERVQAEFNQRFNGYAPAWEADLTQGHVLVDYPGIVERLQSLWSQPARAMDVLERSLTRPDADVETFDLPAYRELLFLYAVARDLCERDAGGREAVDLRVPFDAASPGEEPVVERAAVEPLTATRPVKAQPEARPTISLDLSLDDLAVDAPSADQPDSAETVAGNGIDFEHFPVDAAPARGPRPDEA